MNLLVGNKMASRHFKHRHPLFKKSSSQTGAAFMQSPYYFWWEFLRRHEGYKETCLNGGKGKYAELYKDFGNVHCQLFRDWWSHGDRGALLFAEPVIPVGISIVDLSKIKELVPHIESGSVSLMTIPLSMSKKSIISRFNKIIRNIHTRRRGQRYNTDSLALYPIVAQYSIISLKKSLDAYDLKNGEENLTLWEIGQKLKLRDTLKKMS